MKKFIAGAAAALLVTAGLTLATASAATATTPPDQCVPSDAWTETIDHPAVGEPTITIDNPDYEPAVEEVTDTIEHPAEYETVHHEAEYIHHDAVFKTEWKYTKHGGYGFIWVDNDEFKYIKADGTGTNNKPWLGWYYERTQHTREVEVTPAWDELVKEAWDEQVLVKEAWTETIVVVEGKPAVGEPTIVVDNPDYQPAWTETIEHEAVTCPPAPAAPHADIVTACGSADVTLANEIEEGLTASFVINVDGDFYGAYAVEAGAEPVSVSLTFPEDSGDHTVEVFQAGTSEWALIAEATVESDCEYNIPPKPEVPEPVTTTTYSEWTGGQPDCDTPVVTQTRTRTETTTTVDFVWNAETKEWERTEASSSATFTEERTVTFEGECPTPTPTPDPEPSEDPEPSPEPTDTPEPTPSGDRLAVTGGTVAWTAGAVGAALLALGGTLVAVRRRRVA